METDAAIRIDVKYHVIYMCRTTLGAESIKGDDYCLGNKLSCRVSQPESQTISTIRVIPPPDH